MAGADPFHPELRRVARLLPRTLVTPLTARVFRRMPGSRRSSGADGVQTVRLPSGISVRVHRPPGDPPGRGTPGLLWIHGGGFVLGHPGMDDGLCRRLSRELGATVAAVGYRLAPEHPYPVPLTDCYAALAWLAGHHAVDRTRIAVAGASAGGGLAAALAQLAHDRAEIALAAQILRYPMLDDRSARRPDPHRRHRRMWSRQSNLFGWQSYLGDADPVTAVPARRDDLTGLPPAWIGVGTLDILHDEAVRYASRLRRAGVRCELEVVPGAFHGFDAVAPKTSVAQRFHLSQLEVLRRAFAIGDRH
ncbi:alpha/beta hydrolase [Mycobacterium sp. NPDC050551]|uniref:alpha/beta hydrolase n=1 Tax=Mycobacterium sp. NPDC050551 TaxID=3155407 RepID=UPI003422B1FE